QACDKPVAHRVVDARHDDRYRLRRPLQGARGRRVANHDHVDFLPDQSAGQDIQVIHVAIGIGGSILDVLPVQPAEIVHPLLERRIGFGGTGDRSERHPPDSRCVRGRLSADDPVRNEQADAAGEQDTTTRDHWITSSARNNSDGEMLRPRFFAALTLTTSKYRFGCSTGRSLGFAPLRTFATYTAASLNVSSRSLPYEINPPACTTLPNSYIAGIWRAFT